MNSHGPNMNKRCKYKFNIPNINLTKYQKGRNYTGIKLLIYLPSTIESVNHIIVFKPPLKGQLFCPSYLVDAFTSSGNKLFLGKVNVILSLSTPQSLLGGAEVSQHQMEVSGHYHVLTVLPASKNPLDRKKGNSYSQSQHFRKNFLDPTRMDKHICWLILYCMFTADHIILGKRFFYSPNIQFGSLAQTDSYSMGTGAASQGTNGKDIQVTSHPHPESLSYE